MPAAQFSQPQPQQQIQPQPQQQYTQPPQFQQQPQQIPSMSVVGSPPKNPFQKDVSNFVQNSKNQVADFFSAVNQGQVGYYAQQQIQQSVPQQFQQQQQQTPQYPSLNGYGQQAPPPQTQQPFQQPPNLNVQNPPPPNSQTQQSQQPQPHYTPTPVPSSIPIPNWQGQISMSQTPQQIPLSQSQQPNNNNISVPTLSVPSVQQQHQQPSAPMSTQLALQIHQDCFELSNHFRNQKNNPDNWVLFKLIQSRLLVVVGRGRNGLSELRNQLNESDSVYFGFLRVSCTTGATGNQDFFVGFTMVGTNVDSHLRDRFQNNWRSEIIEKFNAKDISFTDISSKDELSHDWIGALLLTTQSAKGSYIFNFGDGQRLTLKNN